MNTKDFSVIRPQASTAGLRVQSWWSGTRFHMPHGTGKKKKQTNKKHDFLKGKEEDWKTNKKETMSAIRECQSDIWT